MIDFKFQPSTYFSEEVSSVLLVKLHYPESTWGEQISIYAHQMDFKIHLEAVDFYGNDYILYPSKIEEPFNLEDLIYLIEGMQVNQDELDGKMELVLDGVPEASSAFYPELEKYFEEKRRSFGL
ncbi:UDP-glucuronosyltransferase [Algoriphagus algorifonticola]|uniref:UDP-glucuronosyltransferase n=1 Tax=Algoriphagus algorifonticola TaxID=2593007 RepID=UPI00119D3256|nr:UDP-glucuronosyltransferase [Algoriphagus algorifonticola]